MSAKRKALEALIAHMSQKMAEDPGAADEPMAKGELKGALSDAGEEAATDGEAEEESSPECQCDEEGNTEDPREAIRRILRPKHSEKTMREGAVVMFGGGGAGGPPPPKGGGRFARKG